MKIKKNNLILFTGIIWLVASILLLNKAYIWSLNLTTNQLVVTIIVGIVISFAKTILIFNPLNIRNIKRISTFNNNLISILKFHIQKDQIIIVIMIVGGTLLRKSEFISKLYLMPIYFGIGIAMLYSSLLYIIFFIKNYRQNKRINEKYLFK